jgi:hypothetical protein
MKSTTARICPNCGATNTGRSLFCAECGANLNEPVDPNATRPFEPSPSETSAGTAQETEAYRPVWDQTWSGGTETTNATAINQPLDPAPPLPTAAPPDLVPAVAATSVRGFYLGLIAFLIILAVAIALGVLTLL